MGFFSRAKSRVTRTISRAKSRVTSTVSKVKARVTGRTKTTGSVRKKSPPLPRPPHTFPSGRVPKPTTTFQGPVQAGVDPQTFRTTGQSVQVQSVPKTRTGVLVTTVGKQTGGKSSTTIQSKPAQITRVDGFLKAKITQPASDFIERKTGKTIRQNIFSFNQPSKFIEGDTVKFTPFAERSGIAQFERRVEEDILIPSRQFTKGAIASTVEDIRDKPLKNIALLGVGGALGVGIRGTGLGLKAFGGAVGGVRGAKIASRTGAIGLGTAGVIGTGSAVVSTSRELSLAPTPEAKGGVLGVAVKDVGLLGVGTVGGFKGFDVGKDIIRTRGLKEVPTSSVVAPEALVGGQTFPTIRKGQTAGELKAEFFQPSLPGEKAGIGRAFTASGGTFKADTKTGRGTSEVVGMFGAPKISPHFLRTTGEKPQLIGLGTGLEGSTPTALRLTPKSIELTPNIKPSQTKLGPVDKKFFEGIGGTGKSFISFHKTEKQTITAFDSPITKTQEKFFFKFGGRRVPIKEFKTVGGDVKPTPSGVTTLGKASSGSSGKKGASGSVFTPTTTGSISLFRKSRSSSGITPPSSSKIFTTSSVPGSSGSKSPRPPGSRVPSIPKSPRGFGGISSGLFSSTTTKGIGSLILPSSPKRKPRRRKPRLILPGYTGKPSVRRTRGKKKATPPKRIASLAAIGLDIKATKAFRGERTSLGIRPILIDPRKKKKKKKK